MSFLSPSFPRKRESSQLKISREARQKPTTFLIKTLDSRFRGNDGVAVGQRGFTLLEMLVVLVLASIMLSMVAVNFFPDEQRALRDEGERLAYLLEQASKTSRAGGQPLAWSSSGHEHRFWKKNKQGEWRKVEQDALLHARTLPKGMRVTLVLLAERPAQVGDRLALSPELGAPTFELRLTLDTQSLRLVGDGLGNVRVMP